MPEGAEELARSNACTQAFRLGDAAWGIQFHAEVTHDQVEGWLREDHRKLPRRVDELREETRERIDAWNELGRTLSGTFLELAERVAAPA